METVVTIQSWLRRSPFRLVLLRGNKADCSILAPLIPAILTGARVPQDRPVERCP
jgi:hypothetical protein